MPARNCPLHLIDGTQGAHGIPPLMPNAIATGLLDPEGVVQQRRARPATYGPNFVLVARAPAVLRHNVSPARHSTIETRVGPPVGVEGGVRGRTASHS